MLPNCKSFIVTGNEMKHVRRRARVQQHQDASCHRVFSLQGKAPKEIHTILTETCRDCSMGLGPKKVMENLDRFGQ